jgi:hypothetical protein
MFSQDDDRVVLRPLQTQDSPNSSSPPLPSTSLSSVHISEALLQSPDDGATLDLTHRNLIDVGETGAEQLATIGREDLAENESTVLRCVSDHGFSLVFLGELDLPLDIIAWLHFQWHSRFCRVCAI